MSTSRDVDYRLALAEGFLAEADQDFALKRWRSCVDNAQLAVENAGKAALSLFGIVPKTHDPARQIAAILREQELPDGVSELLHAILPDLLVLGTETHFLTDYGDEASYTLPWGPVYPADRRGSFRVGAAISTGGARIAGYDRRLAPEAIGRRLTRELSRPRTTSTRRSATTTG